MYGANMRMTSSKRYSVIHALSRVSGLNSYVPEKDLSKDVLIHVIRNVLGLSEGSMLEQMCKAEGCYDVPTLLMVPNQVIHGPFRGPDGSHISLKSFDAFRVTNLRLFSQWHRKRGQAVLGSDWLSITKEDYEGFIQSELQDSANLFSVPPPIGFHQMTPRDPLKSAQILADLCSLLHLVLPKACQHHPKLSCTRQHRP